MNHCEHCAGPILSPFCVAAPKIEKQKNKLIFCEKS